jgi:adenine-specific DNA-methyltransferase
MALGAEKVGPVSEGERQLADAPHRKPSVRALKLMREQIADGLDPLGSAFCSLRSPETRRAMGATYTPALIVDAMADWAAAASSPDRVVDPGSGSGRFALAAGRRLRTAQLLAVELDPLAALLTRANLQAAGFGSRSSVVVRDYRALSIPRIDGQTLYLGNPPYVRHHQIAPEWKAWLVASARTRHLSASQLAGLHVYFFLATAKEAKPGDRGAFITSSEWLDVNYGSLVRDLLLDGLGGQAIHVIAPEALPFSDAHTTGAITCFEIGSRPKSIRLRRVKSVADLKTLDGGQAVRRERLLEARRWSPLLLASRKVPPGHIELGELCRVHRGAVTGANRVWVVDPAQVDLPDDVLFRTITRARELFAAGASLADDGRLRAVIDLPADLDQLDDSVRPKVTRFLRAARRLGTHQGYVARHRQAWWSVGLRAPAPILATYMARRPPAFVRNLAEARHINIAHGLYPRQPLSEPILDKIADYLRISISTTAGRTYAGGLTKFEPREMERLLIPDLTVT